MSGPLVAAYCNCDAADTWHQLHRVDCAYWPALRQLRYERGIAVNYRDVLAAAGTPEGEPDE